MPRKHVPVRAPRFFHTALRKAARGQGLTVTEYLSRLVTTERLQALAESSGLTGSTYISPRFGDAQRVQEVARRLGCRQWDAWIALQKMALSEGEKG